MACTMAASPVLASLARRGHARSRSTGSVSSTRSDVVVSSTTTPCTAYYADDLAVPVVFSTAPSHQRRMSAPPAFGPRDDTLDDDRQAAPTGAAPDALIIPSKNSLRGYVHNMLRKREASTKPFKERDYPTFMTDAAYER